MSMWELVCNGETIDRVDLKTKEYEEAHTYFRLRKNLNNKSFNDLFIVKEYTIPKKPVGNVNWWRDESTKLDDF